jgi:hypothetical protein
MVASRLARHKTCPYAAGLATGGDGPLLLRFSDKEEVPGSSPGSPTGWSPADAGFLTSRSARSTSVFQLWKRRGSLFTPGAIYVRRCRHRLSRPNGGRPRNKPSRSEESGHVALRCRVAYRLVCLPEALRSWLALVLLGLDSKAEELREFTNRTARWSEMAPGQLVAPGDLAIDASLEDSSSEPVE